MAPTSPPDDSDLVLTAPRSEPPGDRAAALADFHSLPIYRGYVHGVRTRDLPEGFIEGISAPRPLSLVREPDNRHDRRAVAIYLGADKLGYLSREDRTLVLKLGRRGAPLVCTLIGVQSDEPREQQLSIEVALLYPPHTATDDTIAEAERDRRAGLAKVAAKPAHARRLTGDPLSAGHVWAGYYD